MNLNERAEFRMDSLHEPYRLSSLVNRVSVPSAATTSSSMVTPAEGPIYGWNRIQNRTVTSFDQGSLTTKIEDDAIV